MRRPTRVFVGAAVACALAAGLWVGLQDLVGVNLTVTEGAAGTLFTGLVTMGAAWVSSSEALKTETVRTGRHIGVPGTGTLSGVTSIFADREREWSKIRDMVRVATKGNRTQAAIMIHGMPGVGKTEFARHAAQRFVAEYNRHAHRAGIEMLACEVDLAGHEGVAAARPEDILPGLLGPGTLDGRRSTMSAEELAGEWRKHLQDKFLILVLDGAVDERQVRLLLPGGSQYIVLVTGRRMLTGLIDRVEPFSLGVLDGPGARQMMRNIIRRAPGASDQRAMDGIAEVCEYLPQAIKEAAAAVAWRPGFSFSDKLAELKHSPGMLLSADQYSRGSSGGVARSFEASYVRLSDRAKLVLRRMGLAPVPVIREEVLAALAGLSKEDVSASLAELLDEALVEEREHGRYRLHDLVRRYARMLAERDDSSGNDEAVSRVLAYYWGTAVHADSIFTRQPPPPAMEPPMAHDRQVFADQADEIAWIQAETHNLLACADYVSRHVSVAGHSREKVWLVLFAGALAGILRNDGRWRRSIDLQTEAVKAAAELCVPLAEANALSERAYLYRLISELDLAVADVESAIAIYRQVGGSEGKTGEAHALDTHGVILDRLSRGDEAQRSFARAAQIYRELNDSLGEANVLHDEGMLELFAGRPNEAIALLSRSLTIYQAINQPLGVAHASGNLARAQREIGADREAAQNLELARDQYLRLGNRLGASNALIQQGAALRGRHRREAKSVLNDAIRLSLEIGDQLAYVNALAELGELYMASRRKRAALRTWERALAVASQYGLKRAEEALTDRIERGR